VTGRECRFEELARVQPTGDPTSRDEAYCRAAASEWFTWRTRLMLLLLFTLCVACSGCAFAHDYVGAWRLVLTRFDYEKEASPGLVLINLRHHSQPERLLCGPSALASVIVHYDPDTSWSRCFEGLSGSNEGEWTMSRLAAAARAEGYEATVVRAEDAQIREWILKGWPPLLAVAELHQGPHALILIGFHSEKGYWVVDDPRIGFRKFSSDYLARIWERAGRLCLIVTPTGKGQAEATRGDWAPATERQLVETW